MATEVWIQARGGAAWGSSWEITLNLSPFPATWGDTRRPAHLAHGIVGRSRDIRQALREGNVSRSEGLYPGDLHPGFRQEGGSLKTPGAGWGHCQSPMSHQAAEGSCKGWGMEEAAPSFPGGLLQDCDHLTLTPAIGEGQELSRQSAQQPRAQGPAPASGCCGLQGPLGRHGHLERGLVGPQDSPCVRVWGACLADPTSLLPPATPSTWHQ